MSPKYWLAVVSVFVVLHLVTSTWFVHEEASRRTPQGAPASLSGGGHLAPGLHPVNTLRRPSLREAIPPGFSSVEDEFPTSDPGELNLDLPIGAGHADDEHARLPLSAVASLPAWDDEDELNELDGKDGDQGGVQPNHNNNDHGNHGHHDNNGNNGNNGQGEKPTTLLRSLTPWERLQRRMAQGPPPPKPPPEGVALQEVQQVSLMRQHDKLHVCAQGEEEEGEECQPEDAWSHPSAWVSLRLSDASEQVIRQIRTHRLALCDDSEDAASHCYLTGHPHEMYCQVQHLRMGLAGFHTRLLYDNLPAPERYMDVALSTFQMADCPQPHVQTRLRQAGVTPRYSSADWVHSVDQPGDLLHCPASGWKGGQLYLLTRYEYVNVYHTSVELFTLWLHAQIEDLASLHLLQVVFTDPHLPGPLDDVWAKLTGKAPWRVTDMGDDPQEDPVQCYQNAYFSISNKDNAFDSWVGANQLLGTKELGIDSLGFLYRDFRSHMRRVYEVSGARMNSLLVQMTLIVRRDYAKTARRLKVDRKFANEDELIEQLQSIEGAELNVVDMAFLSYEEQVLLMSHTDVLIGVHGAGLAQLLYLPDKSCVLEVATSTFASRPHFQNPCRLLGHHYERYTVPSGGHWDEIHVPADALRAHAVAMVELMQKQAHIKF